MGKTIKGDFGESIRYSRPVSLILIERLPLTIELGTVALILAVVVGIPLGIVSAIRQNSAIDVGTMVLANTGVSMPVYWLGLMLAYLFAIILKDTPLWLPPSGRLTAGFTSIPFYEVFGWVTEPETFKFYLLDFISNHFILNSLITGQWEVLGMR